MRDEYRARLAEGLIDPEAAIGRVFHTGLLETLPRDSGAAVDRAVARAVDVVTTHKRDIAEARAMAMDVLRLAGDAEEVPAKRAAILDRAVNALAKAITMERQAYGIVEDAAGGGDAVVPIEERLRAYAASGGLPRLPSHATSTPMPTAEPEADLTATGPIRPGANLPGPSSHH